jgi:predicted phosphate transport protein (TIGR00153 family)
MLFSKFFPKEFNFFDSFEKQADYAIEGARKLKEIAHAPGLISPEAYKKINDLEHQADQASHSIIDQLNTTFITPFDREDIYALTKELDDILDMINTVVSRIKVYKVSGEDKSFMQFTAVIEESVIAVASAVKGLRTMKNTKDILKSCIEVNRLENVGDKMRDEVLGRLFETEKDPIALIKWKEIYEDAETLLDICEDVVHVVESILVKQA